MDHIIMKLWSSQLWRQFLHLRKEAWKIQDFNRVWTCDLAIPVRRSNQLSLMTPLTLGAGHLWVLMFPWVFEPVHICMWSISIIPFHCCFILHGNMIRTHKWPAPNVSGFIAQLVRVSHWYRKVKDSNPVEVLKFSGFFTQLQKLHS